MSSDTSSDLSELELLRAQVRAAQAEAAAEKRAREDAEVAVAAERQAREQAEAVAAKVQDELEAERLAHTAIVQELKAAKESIKRNAYLIQKLEEQLARLKRLKFGQSSERVAGEAAQLMLSLEDLEASNAFDTALINAISARAKGGPAPSTAEEKRKPKRKPLPDHLPRQDVIYPAPGGDACRACGGQMRSFGEDVSETLEYIPSRVVAVRHRRPKFSCDCCDTIDQAPAPNRVIPQGLPGPNLLAHVVVSKFGDHLPLYRQSVIYKREGVDLSRSTLADWVGQVSWLLQPLVDVLYQHVLESPKIHADDTTVKVLAPGTGKTKTGRLWVYVRDNRSWNPNDPPAAVFFYSPDRKGEHPVRHLKAFTGFLQADAYSGYSRLYEADRTPGSISAVGCWAHARRYLFDVFDKDPNSIVLTGIEMIKALYGIERRAKGQPLTERIKLREESRPIVEAYFRWAESVLARVSTHAPEAKALKYSIGCKATLIRFLDDARLEIDNNIAENSLRGVALGRKNYLFAGADVGGDRAAAIYSLVETAKLHNLNVQEWLADVLQRIADGLPITRIKELLPWNWVRGSSYRHENGFPPQASEHHPWDTNSLACAFGHIEAPEANGTRYGEITMGRGGSRIRVRSEIDSDTLLIPAEVDVQIFEGDVWVRAGRVTKEPNGKLFLDLRIDFNEPVRFQLHRQDDGGYKADYVTRNA
jgi:transposase